MKKYAENNCQSPAVVEQIEDLAGECNLRTVTMESLQELIKTFQEELVSERETRDQILLTTGIRSISNQLAAKWVANQRFLTALTGAPEWDKMLREQLDEARSQTCLENRGKSSSKGLSRNKRWRERMNKDVPWDLMY